MPRFKPNKRLLHERSFLTLEFPQSDDRVIKARIPMLENCSITENGKANLAEYNLLGRSNSFHAYMGAKARTFSLSFNITLLHVLETLSTEDIADHFKRVFSLGYTKEKVRSLFLELEVIPGEAAQHARSHRSYYQNVAGIVTPPKGLFDSGLDSVLTWFGLPASEPQDAKFEHLNGVIDMVLHWLNLIRSTTLNNSSNTTQACPIVRLTHGVAFNALPCVVEDYSITWDESAGHEVNTLLAKKYTITLSLKENRTGNFGKFQVGEITKGDNHVGWEAIIESNNLDPYNDLIELTKDEME